MTDTHALLRAIAATLDGLDVALCAFDLEDRTIAWNRAFLRFFPEHAGHVHVGEPYRANLQRFYEARLDAAEMPAIGRYIDEGIVRHRNQHRPYTFRHRGAWLQVSSLSLPDVGRLRTWRRIPSPPLSDTLAPARPSDAHASTDNTELFEHVGDGVMLTSADNRITWVNEHFLRMFAMASKPAAVGMRLEDVYSSVWRGHGDEGTDRFDAGLSTLTENLRFAGAPFELPLPGRRWVRVVEQRRADGVGFFALVDISVLKTQQQELIVAERRARESQGLLAEKSRLLEATLQSMEQGVMMVNADGIVDVCNRKAIELLGLPVELMAGRPRFNDVLAYQLSTGEFANMSEDLRRFLRDGGFLEAPPRYDRVRPNGRVIEIESVPIEGGGILRTYTDITERRHAETTRRALEAQLREAHKLESIGTLAGGIAHDFNNIMGAILGNVSFALEAARAGEPAEVYLQQINTAGRRARSLVQQILAFSNQQTNEFVTVPLGSLLEETLTLVRASVSSAVQVRAVLPDARLAVLGNPTQLQQVLLNLGTNAWQAFGGAPGHIEIGLDEVAVHDDHPLTGSALEAGPHAHIWVRDDGCGMSPEMRARIFEPFFTTKPVGQGTGLGLSVAYGIVEAHGGAIVVDSAVGAGSTFHVYLPLVDHESQPTPLDTSDSDRARGAGQHVLYVDDDEVMSVMVHGLLLRLGYRATCTVDAREALALVAREPASFDVVVTDFNMPHLSGLDVVRALARIRADLPVAVSSGYISEELRSSARELGVSGLMHKENTLEELAPLLRSALSRKPS